MDKLRKMGPLSPGEPTVGRQCPACHEDIKAGDYVTSVALGPGDDEEARGLARAGRPYNATCAVVHWACATGEVN